MSSKMLIDASHPEETRVVVLRGHRIEEFDFESASKRQLRGNIYLAKVTRVEPSLQAAFVDYGGNRHGFLAFSEIHPDYYQIPHADRQALLEEEARAHRDEDDEGRSNGHRRSRRHKRDNSVAAMGRRDSGDSVVSEPAFPAQDSEGSESRSDLGPIGFDGGTDEAAEAEFDFSSDSSGEPSGFAGRPSDSDRAGAASGTDHSQAEAELDASAESGAAVSEHAPIESGDEGTHASFEEGRASRAGPAENAGPVVAGESADEFQPQLSTPHTEMDLPSSADATVALIEGGSDSLLDLPSESIDSGGELEADEHAPEDDAEEEIVEQIGGDEFEETVQRSPRSRRHYKIQEVIKRRQILLVQVVKEERGNKGAALTTYLSLAGRYSVLMPNTARGGGISRKITDPEDRKRLKVIAQDLEVPEGMGIILRTAGAARSKVEVNRDFEYLLRMWESVRELTLKSTAPSLVYEEGSLIKRSIRDLYTRDVEEVIVAGEEGYREAKDFMRMLMPSAAKNVQLYRDSQPIFAKTGAEAQLDAMFSNHVTLKSGGYLVINQTEALVAIDVNSGRSTREHNIEDTALRTNLEAADEIARQLRLRDLAGLIVVDFIDMEEGRNNRSVERRIKEALKNDRARIQIGRISHFGLLEMSRQRIRTGVLEGSTVVCPHCAGTGTVRSTASIALHVLRLVEDALIKDASHNLIVRTRTEVALYVLNQKRSTLNDLEARFGVSLSIAADQSLTGMVYHAIERGEIAMRSAPPQPRSDLVRVDSVGPIYDQAEEGLAGEEDDEDLESVEETQGDGEAAGEDAEFAPSESNGDGRRRRRRRRRRGRERDPQAEAFAAAAPPSSDSFAGLPTLEGEASGSEPDVAGLEGETSGEPDAVLAHGASSIVPPAEDSAVSEPPRRRRTRRGASRAEESGIAAEGAGSEGSEGEGALASDDPAREDGALLPKRRRAPRSRAAAPTLAEADGASMPLPPVADAEFASDSSGSPPAGDIVVATLEAEDGTSAPAEGDRGESRPVAPTEPAGMPTPAEPEPDRPKRSGWWQRAKATFGS